MPELIPPKAVRHPVRVSQAARSGMQDAQVVTYSGSSESRVSLAKKIRARARR